jgi:hypothetical protein
VNALLSKSAVAVLFLAFVLIPLGLRASPYTPEDDAAFPASAAAIAPPGDAGSQPLSIEHPVHLLLLDPTHAASGEFLIENRDVVPADVNLQAHAASGALLGVEQRTLPGEAAQPLQRADLPAATVSVMIVPLQTQVQLAVRVPPGSSVRLASPPIRERRFTAAEASQPEMALYNPWEDTATIELRGEAATATAILWPHEMHLLEPVAVETGWRLNADRAVILQGVQASAEEAAGMEAAAEYDLATGPLAAENPTSLTGGTADGDAVAPLAAPLPPASLTATATANTQIKLGWQDKSGNELGFKIERRTGSGAWAQIAAVGVNVTGFYSNGLSNATTYSYRVRAHNASGGSAYSNIATAQTGGPLSKPAVPTALTATAASASRINLAWQDNSNNETGFYVERRAGTGAWARIATLGANTKAYASGGLAAATTYGYRVQAYRSSLGTSAYSNEARATTPPGGGPRLHLNDTGIDGCADGNRNHLPCPVAGFPGQDAQYGRDQTANNDSDGPAGFSFTKLDGNGNPLAASATSWSCVRDNVTGLTWEVKTDDGGLRDKDWLYSWYNPDPTTNGGSAGTQNGGSCSGSACDTHAFTQAVNAQGLCGVRDWRLPSDFELLSIVSNDRYNPAIDTAWFPNTQSGRTWFWSSSPYVRFADDAWYVFFNNGFFYSGAKVYPGYVRLVRGGQ